MPSRPFRVQAPGRVCLFGEHSDYLGLNVIPAALDLSITITVHPRQDKLVKVDYKDLGIKDSFRLDREILYSHNRDYIRSAFNVLSRRGAQVSEGCDLEVSGDIPIAVGLAGSSALTVAALVAVSNLSGEELSTDMLAKLAFETEVVEFGESGGMMDHFASAYGGIIHLDLGEVWNVTQLPAALEGFVIGDSMEKKADTVGDLRAIRSAVEQGYKKIAEELADFDQRKTPVFDVVNLITKRTDEFMEMAKVTLVNRDLTQRALAELNKRNPNPETVGAMLDEHHALLRDGLRRSTEKIEKLISAAKGAGALGCKINGSGGGGTMLAYAPGHEHDVAAAIRRVGGSSYVVKIANGAKISPLND